MIIQVEKRGDGDLKRPVLKLTAGGSYDLLTENMDAMIAVEPFGAYSTFLKDIPPLGS